MEIDSTNITAPVYVLGFDASKIGMQVSINIDKVLAEEFKVGDYKVIKPGGHDYMLEKTGRILHVSLRHGLLPHRYSLSVEQVKSLPFD